jgi:hypothetical protein
MTHTTIRVRKATHAALKSLAKANGRSMQALLEDLVQRYSREKFLDRVNEAYARLRSDPRASKDYDNEISAWDATLLDGLSSDDASIVRETPAVRARSRKGRRRR